MFLPCLTHSWTLSDVALYLHKHAFALLYDKMRGHERRALLFRATPRMLDAMFEDMEGHLMPFLAQLTRPVAIERLAPYIHEPEMTLVSMNGIYGFILVVALASPHDLSLDITLRVYRVFERCIEACCRRVSI